MVAEAAGPVMVLAMHIHGDSAAEGGVAGARRHRHDEAARQEGAQEVGEGDARLGGELAALGVERQQAIEPLGQ